MHPCPDCGSHVHRSDATCPHCGTTMGSGPSLSAVGALLGLALLAGGCPSGAQNADYGTAMPTTGDDDDATGTTGDTGQN